LKVFKGNTLNLLSRVGKSRGVSKTIFVIIIVGLIGVTFFFVKIYLPPTDEDLLENLESPTFGAVIAGTSESLPPVTEIDTLDDALIDLENLGCSVVNVTEVEGQGSGVGFFLEYSEFRKVASKQKLVFLLYYYGDDYDKLFPYLTTCFENINVVWFPEKDSFENEESPKFEKVEIQTGICTKDSSGWTITITLKNTGSEPSKINRILVSDVAIEQAYYGLTTIVEGKVSTDLQYSGTTLQRGQIMKVHVRISKSYKNFTSGTTINIKFHSTSGMVYIKLIELV
jgi:hypothetical protein